MVAGITLSPLIVLRTIWTFFHEIDSSSLFQSILLSVRYLLLFELLSLAGCASDPGGDGVATAGGTPTGGASSAPAAKGTR